MEGELPATFADDTGHVCWGTGWGFRVGLGNRRSGLAKRMQEPGGWREVSGGRQQPAAGMWLEHDAEGLTLEKSRGWGAACAGGCWGWKRGAAWAREQRGGHGWGPLAVRGGQNLEMVFAAGGVRCWRCLGLSWEHHDLLLCLGGGARLSRRVQGREPCACQKAAAL